MPSFKFDNTFSITNVVSFITFVLMLTGAWVTLDNQVDQILTEIKRQEVRLGVAEERVRTNENRLTRQDEKFSSVLNSLDRIEKAIDDLRKAQ